MLRRPAKIPFLPTRYERALHSLGDSDSYRSLARGRAPGNCRNMTVGRGWQGAAKTGVSLFSLIAKK
jgi:hypothetical protein